VATILDPDGDALLDPDGEPITIGPGYPDLVLSPTPNFYFRLGESGSANPIDSGPNGYSSALGGTYTWGEPGALAGDPDTALALNPGDFGLRGEGGFATRVALTADQSRLAWVKTTSTDDSPGYEGNAALTVMGDTSSGVWDGFGVTGGFVQFNRFNNSTWQHLTGTTAVNDGEWHMIAATYDSTTGEVVVYVDGEVDGGGTVTSHQAQGGISHIGRGYSSGDVFDGTLDEVAAFATVLSPADISALYAAAVSGGEPAIPPTVEAAHVVAHGGALVVQIPLVITSAHLALHGGALDVPLPPTVATAHLPVHGGEITIPAGPGGALIAAGGSGRYPVGARS
jgi:hypothetical protein